MPLLTEREQLARLVEQWNENRLELFHLSYPTEDLEIEGVMRFYFQEGGEKVLTKCVRVSSTATTRAVVDALADKFLPDLKMLTHDTYSLWEIHENGEERKLDDEEKPLLVQLMWHRDDREGRFLLRRDRTPVIPLTAGQLKEAENMKRGQKRYSKRDKNDKKKKHKDVVTVNNGREEAGVPPGLVSTDIYKQLPSNTFTRTISNPEVVMKKRRERKLESKLKEIKQGEGGSLKVYGGEVVPSRPYVTILASINDSGERILNEALEKYGLLDNKDDYVLVEMPCSSEHDEIKNSQGRIVAPDENPLMTIATRVQKNENAVDTYLSIQRKPADYRVPTTSAPEASIRSNNSYTPEPSLIVLDEEGRTQIPQHHVQIRTGVTEVGSDRALSQFSPQNIYLDGPDIRGRHCVVTFMDGVVTITPSATDAYIEVNNRRLYQTEILCDGDLLRIGASHLFRFSSNSRPASQPSDSRAPTQGDYTALTQSMYAARLEFS